MALITHIRTVLVIVAAALPFAASTSILPQICLDLEFWFPLDGCLPIGGPPSPPKPPKGYKCPPTSYYWGDTQGCCVPRFPPPEQSPPPLCVTGWDWIPAVRRCERSPTSSSPPPPRPSKHPGGAGGKGNTGHDDGNSHDDQGGSSSHSHTSLQSKRHRKRTSQLKSRSAYLCPSGLDACPISGVQTGDYECLDTAAELESCGGCASLGMGQDCSAIHGAWNVGCDRGHCAVYTCAGGFKRAEDGKTCIAL